MRRAVETPTDESPLLLAHPELDDESRERIRAGASSEYVQPALADHLAALEGYAGVRAQGGGHVGAARRRASSTRR